ncbi:UNVERIFIED_CONTAM: hypothetical protein B566_EDAN016758 [Ephemera danica]|nr:hypothetical protein B566_EDAN016758 [Ephemera danica]
MAGHTAQGRLLGTQDAAGNTTDYEYDVSQNPFAPVRMKFAGLTRDMRFDNRDRVTEQTERWRETDANGQEQTRSATSKSPGTGRYVQRDPIGFEGGVNQFSYASLDPLDLSDAFGLASCPGRWVLMGTEKNKTACAHFVRDPRVPNLCAVLEIFNNRCWCYWLCVGCSDAAILQSGDFRDLPRTQGVWVFSITGREISRPGRPTPKGPGGTPGGEGVAGGNTCLCSKYNTPGPETGCSACGENYPGLYNVQDPR